MHHPSTTPQDTKSIQLTSELLLHTTCTTQTTLQAIYPNTLAPPTYPSLITTTHEQHLSTLTKNTNTLHGLYKPWHPHPQTTTQIIPSDVKATTL